MADVWANSTACHPRATCHITGCCHQRIQQHVIPEPRITLQGAATWWIHCHDSRATCHIAGCSHLTNIAGCNNSIRHIFVFLMQFDWALRGGFRIVSDTLVWYTWLMRSLFHQSVCYAREQNWNSAFFSESIWYQIGHRHGLLYHKNICSALFNNLP